MKKKNRFHCSYDDVLNPEMLEDVEKEYDDLEGGRIDPSEFHSGLSLRDQEFLKHSSLFSHQKPSGATLVPIKSTRWPFSPSISSSSCFYQYNM